MLTKVPDQTEFSDGSASTRKYRYIKPPKTANTKKDEPETQHVEEIPKGLDTSVDQFEKQQKEIRERQLKDLEEAQRAQEREMQPSSNLSAAEKERYQSYDFKKEGYDYAAETKMISSNYINREQRYMEAEKRMGERRAEKLKKKVTPAIAKQKSSKLVTFLFAFRNISLFLLILFAIGYLLKLYWYDEGTHRRYI